MARQTVHRCHDDGIDRWEMADAAPAAHLSAFVGHYGDYQEQTGSFSSRRELASTSGVLIVNLGDPLEIVGADGSCITLGRGEGFAGGLADATSISRSTGAQAGVHVRAPLATIGRILGCPPSEIVNRVVTLGDALGSAARDLGEQLAGANSAAARFDRLDTFVSARLAATIEDDPRIALAATALRRRPALAVAGLADGLNFDRRAFARAFRQALGVSPRRYARLARFESFVAAIGATPTAPIADLAAAAGYYDQPHLNRELRTLAAMTPVELRQRIIPDGGGVRHE